MRRTLLGLTLGLCGAFAVWAQDANSPGAGIEGTIRSQIDAFLIDDFALAFTFASPSIQGMFGSAENFGAMVRNGYPMVWRPEDLRFGELREVAGGLWQRVFVTDANGAIHALDYQMVQMDGQWRIAGVQLLPRPDVSA